METGYDPRLPKSSLALEGLAFSRSPFEGGALIISAVASLAKVSTYGDLHRSLHYSVLALLSLHRDPSPSITVHTQIGVELFSP